MELFLMGFIWLIVMIVDKLTPKKPPPETGWEEDEEHLEKIPDETFNL